MAEPVLRIGVIGAGPKALSALDSLGRRLRAHDDPRRVLIDVIDATGRPGTGTAYDPAQPEHLRLNVSAAIVDAHEPGADDRVTPSFRQWAQQSGSAAEDYPPRAVIGAYLQQAWHDVVAAMPDRVRLRVRHGRATELRRLAHEPLAWELRIRTGAAELSGVSAEWVGPYDEVLIAAGHGADHPDALHHAWQGPVPLVPAVYPTTERLSPEAVAPGARVAVRGAALTFIDAALALTEGRDGEFCEHPDGRLRYRPSGQEPAAILPIARSGLLLDAKPDPGSSVAAALQEGLSAEIVTAGRAAVAEAGDVSELLAVVERTAQRLLQHARGEAAERAGAEAMARAGGEAEGETRIEARCAAPADAAATGGGHPTAVVGELDAPVPREIVDAVSATLETGAQPGPAEGRASRALRASIAAAQGEAPGGPVWALGRAWSLLYSSIVECISFAEIPEGQWAEFRAAAVMYERWAFGPPLLNARRIEALIEVGIVDLTWLEAGVRLGLGGSASTPDGADLPTPDVVVDAVLAPPGIPPADPLLSGLLERGVLSIPPGRRGCRITPEAAAVDRDGQPVLGLSVLGRPTEDVVLGHDTLNRALHDQPQRWAQRILQSPPNGRDHPGEP